TKSCASLLGWPPQGSPRRRQLQAGCVAHAVIAWDEEAPEPLYGLCLPLTIHLLRVWIGYNQKRAHLARESSRIRLLRILPSVGSSGEAKMCVLRRQGTRRSEMEWR